MKGLAQVVFIWLMVLGLLSLVLQSSFGSAMQTEREIKECKKHCLEEGYPSFEYLSPDCFCRLGIGVGE